jgi:catechol 2,3-dioxygenase-like lactoylglutathione lyase family enzyme
MADSIFSRSDTWTDVFCTDYDRCLTFYRDTLGLEVEEFSSMPGNAVVYAGRGNKLALHKSDTGAGEHTVASFLTDDFSGAIDHLRSKGVKLEDYGLPGIGVKTVDGIASQGDFKAAWFKDPGGNVLCVSPSYSTRPLRRARRPPSHLKQSG